MSYPDFIEELILAKLYTELSEVEKKQVAEWVSDEDEYNNIRQLLIGLNTAFIADEDEVPAHIKNNLQQAFAQKYTPKKRSTFSWRAIAIVSIAASVALLVYVGVLFTKENTTSPTAVTTETPTTEQAPTEKPFAQEKEIVKNGSQDQLPPSPSTEDVFVHDLNTNTASQSNNESVAEDIEIVEDEVAPITNQVETFEPTFKNLEKKESYSAPAAPQRLNAPLSEELKYKAIITNTVTVKENNDLLDLSVTVY